MSTDRKPLGTIELYTHGLRIRCYDDRIKVACRRLLNAWCVHAERKVENARGEMVTERYVSQMFGAAFKNQNDFWIHKGQLIDFKREIAGMGASLEDFKIITVPVHTPKNIKVELKKGRVLRDYQEDAKAFTLKEVPQGDHHSKLVAIPTGGGKTVTLCGTAVQNSERLVIGVLPKYLTKWALDLESNLDIAPKQIMMIEKTTQLRGVVDLCRTQGHGKLPPLIIITLSTLRIFFDKFMEDPEGTREDMGCEPWELMGLMGAGMFGIDEAHEHLNTVFLTSMYLHGVKFMALSGTMRTEDEFQEKVQNTIFPQIKRYLEVKMKKYIDVEFIGYNFDPSIARSIKYQAFGRSDYSHPVLEKSIMKNPVALQGYIKMTTDLLDFDYIPRAKGHRALIFVATVEMADKMIVALTMRYPQLNIARYCAAQGDKYEDLLTADLTVSTLQSSGTAVDIPDLITVICTTVVNSSKSNIQALGRLRDLGPEKKVTMFMPYCRQNPKHLKYMAFRQELFKDITKSIQRFNYDRFIGRRY